jgi:L-asparaginase II
LQLKNFLLAHWFNSRLWRILPRMEESHRASGAAPLVIARRGGWTESIHYGHIAVVDGRGELIAFSGNPEFKTFPRSCAKFLQALPLILVGAADHYGLTDPEIAIACASHEGEEFQIERVRSILLKIDLDESALRCGSHCPASRLVADELLRTGREPTPIHNNCSGKHAGMLAVAKYTGAPLDSYTDLDHPVQQRILKLLQTFTGAETIGTAIDGCSVPTFYLTMREMALLFARLGNPSAMGDPQINSACARIWQCVSDNPELISNRTGLDAQIMRAAKGRLLAKGGAEAMFCFSARPSGKWPEGLGVAVKIEDGTGSRARAPAVLALLGQLRALEPGDLLKLENLFPRKIRNCAGREVGSLHSITQLAGLKKFTEP